MARRRGSGIDTVAAMPWQAGIVLGLIGYIAIRYGVGWILGTSSNPYLSGMGKIASTGVYAPLAWLALVACWIGALISYLNQRKRRELLNAQTGLDSLRAMHWREFEMLVGEAFRRQGYAIQESGSGGADGGIDLILRKDGATTLVQCKQWRTQRVDVRIVREMYGLMVHHQASAVKIVAVGNYTSDAQRFIQGKPIQLIHGEALLVMVRGVQASTPGRIPPASTPVTPTAAVPTCPNCSVVMVQRENRRTKDLFWGCPSYPACRGTRQAG